MSKKKILIGVGIAFLLFIMLAAAGGSTPKTVDQFISNYNSEIKNTARNDSIAKSCSLNNVVTNLNGSKMKSFFDDSIAFMTYDHSNSFSVVFNFVKESVSADVLFPMIEVAILASGDNPNEVMKNLGVLNGDRYNIPGTYEKKISFNSKEYSLMSVDEYIIFSIEMSK